MPKFYESLISELEKFETDDLNQTEPWLNIDTHKNFSGVVTIYAYGTFKPEQVARIIRDILLRFGLNEMMTEVRVFPFHADIAWGDLPYYIVRE